MKILPVLATNPFETMAQPITSLLNMVLPPALLLVGAIGAIFCIFLGVKFAKAEEPQEREKAKNALKNAIIGFVLIFVLLVVLRVGLQAMTNWMTTAGAGTGT
ncbi:MAG: pilin [Clostridiales bacterium]|jgi:TRAP-type C4-dicarboxylate transport system permease large subunit|nr:pilin [Clostridiales bacterium]